VRRFLVVGIALAVLAAGCGGSQEGELTVFAAASLTEVFPEIDLEARYNFAGSDDLATQIREGADADVYAAASPKYPLELREEGLVGEPVVFATNTLVLIVPKDNPAGIGSVADVAQPGVKLVVAAEGVPVGDYTRKALETMGATDVLDNVVSNEDDVKGVVGKVSLGEADAGFVYATDVKPVEGDVAVVELPPEAQPDVEYMIAVVLEGDEQAAAAFVEQVLGPRGRAALTAAGFGVP
jgi:molybdate transport system substrate-binding protein